MRQTEEEETKEKVVIYVRTKRATRKRVKKACKELGIGYDEFIDLCSYLYVEDPLVRRTVREEVMSRRQEFGEFRWRPASKE